MASIKCVIAGRSLRSADLLNRYNASRRALFRIDATLARLRADRGKPRRMGSLIWEIANGSTKLTIDQNPQPNLCLQAALKSGLLGIMLAEL